jgi:hypothetical protein
MVRTPTDVAAAGVTTPAAVAATPTAVTCRRGPGRQGRGGQYGTEFH